MRVPSSTVLLTPAMFHVLDRVPAVWWSQDETIANIARVTGMSSALVCRRLTWLVSAQLCERRVSPLRPPYSEIRKIALPAHRVERGVDSIARPSHEREGRDA